MSLGDTQSRAGGHIRQTGPIVSLGLFVLALLPRALGLRAFVTADEAKWVYRSAQFLGALLRGDLAGTVVNYTPGVTTTWLGSLGLAIHYALNRAELGVSFAEWLASLPEFRVDLDVLVAVRWPMVVLASLSVVAFYHLARRLTSNGAALLFALLLAFDPHFISLSRVLGHDAPASLFVGLSLLAFLQSLIPGGHGVPKGHGVPSLQSPIFDPQPPISDGETPISTPPPWGWLLLSGALSGLAWLSKSPAFFLVPFVGLVTLVEAWRRSAPLRVWLLRLVVWGAVAWIVFALVWPVGWQDPVGAPYSVVHNAFLSATKSVEARGEGYWQVPELGPLYYPVNGAFVLSPLATLGLIAWAWMVISRREKASPIEWWAFAFVVLFTLFMTMGGKRSNRYILPAWPALYLLAAVGLSQISLACQPGQANVKCQMSNVKSPISNLQFQTSNLRLWRAALYGLLALLLLLPAAITYPYYLSYFNLFFGGPLTAPRLVKIGWGEGLDRVGRWLEEQPEAAALRVGSYYASTVTPFFSGKVVDVTSGGLDYVVLYLKQVQGGFPSPTILRYYQAERPLHTVRVDGIDYARIYAGPAVQPALANEAAYDIGILPKPLAFRPGRPYLPIGEEVTIDVLWLVGDELPQVPSRLTLHSVDDLSRHPDERSDEVFAQSSAQLERRSEGLVVSQHNLQIPSDLPRGVYGLLVDGRPLGEVEAGRFTFPRMDSRLDADFGGQVSLVGYTFDPFSARLNLVWQAAPKAWADYTAFVHLVDETGERLAGHDAPPPVPSSQWARGEIVIDERTVPVPDGLPSGDYRLVVGLYRSDTGEPLSLLDSAGKAVGDCLTLPVHLSVPMGESSD